MANGNLRVLIAGGGSGGHVIPALAVARELVQNYGAQVRFVGTARGLETRLVPAAGFPLDLIQVGQLNHVRLTTKLATPCQAASERLGLQAPSEKISSASCVWRRRLCLRTGDDSRPSWLALPEWHSSPMQCPAWPTAGSADGCRRQPSIFLTRCVIFAMGRSPVFLCGQNSSRFRRVLSTHRRNCSSSAAAGSQGVEPDDAADCGRFVGSGTRSHHSSPERRTQFGRYPSGISAIVGVARSNGQPHGAWSHSSGRHAGAFWRGQSGAMPQRSQHRRGTGCCPEACRC